MLTLDFVKFVEFADYLEVYEASTVTHRLKVTYDAEPYLSDALVRVVYQAVANGYLCQWCGPQHRSAKDGEEFAANKERVLRSHYEHLRQLKRISGRLVEGSLS